MKKAVLVLSGDADQRCGICTYVGKLKDVLVVPAVDSREAIVKLARQKFQLLVVDFDLEESSPNDFFRTLSALSPSNRPEQVVSLSTDLLLQGEHPALSIRNLQKPLGLDELSAAVSEALFSLSAARPDFKVDVNFINPFIAGTMEVLAMTCATEAVKESISIRKEDQISGDISALVAMNASLFCGSMAVSFEESCFLSLVGKMLGDTFVAISEENSDAAAEICNQILGRAKKVLNEQGHDLQPAIPSVICGKNHRIKHMINGPCIAVKFRTESGAFTVEAVVQANDSRK